MAVVKTIKRVKPTPQQAWDRYTKMQQQYAIWQAYEKMRFEDFLIYQSRNAALKSASELIWDLRVQQWNEKIKPTQAEVLDFVSSKYAIPMPRETVC